VDKGILRYRGNPALSSWRRVPVFVETATVDLRAKLPTHKVLDAFSAAFYPSIFGTSSDMNMISSLKFAYPTTLIPNGSASHP